MIAGQLDPIECSCVAGCSALPLATSPQASAQESTKTSPAQLWRPISRRTAPASATPPSASEFRTLDEDVQDLKKQVLDLNRDLFLLEEELLFPANTQVAIFVSMDVGEFFGLDSV